MNYQTYTSNGTFSSIADAVKERLDDALQTMTVEAKDRVNGRTSYVCPLCGHGKNGDGLTVDTTSKTGHSLKCFGCGFSGSVIDLYMETNKTDFISATKELAAALNIQISSQNESGKNREYVKPVPLEKNPDANDAYGYWRTDDYKKYFSESFQRRSYCDYLTKRGISREVQDRFRIGYDPAWRHPSVIMKGYTYIAPTPRVIVPTGPTSYLARDIRPADQIPADQMKYKKSKVGRTYIYNLAGAINANEPIFVVEGEIDALSIIEVGGNAIGLGSTTMVGTLLKQFERADSRPRQPLIICLDTDEPGRNASEKLSEGLRKLGIGYYTESIVDTADKDPNDCLVRDRTGFSNRVHAVIDQVKTADQTAKEARKAEYMQSNAKNRLAAFRTRIETEGKYRCVSTGFSNLDAVLDGGLYSGALYTLGAGTGQGKTSIAHQIADNIAVGGTDVLYYSLEVGAEELMARSISRLSVDACDDLNWSPVKTATSYGYGLTLHTIMSDIPKKKRWIEQYRSFAQTRIDGTDSNADKPMIDEEKQIAVLDRAMQKYEEYADHLYLRYDINRIGIDDISADVQKHISLTGNVPIVIVDYVQMLRSEDPRLTDKQNVDNFMFSLKKIAVENSTAVFILSSLNRGSYGRTNTKSGTQFKEVELDAFKESGAIEFTSDVVLGLQYTNLYRAIKGSTDDRNNYDEDKEAQKDVRELCLRVLKNRNGATRSRVYFNYRSMFFRFEEAAAPDVTSISTPLAPATKKIGKKKTTATPSATKTTAAPQAETAAPEPEMTVLPDDTEVPAEFLDASSSIPDIPVDTADVWAYPEIPEYPDDKEHREDNKLKQFTLAMRTARENAVINPSSSQMVDMLRCLSKADLEMPGLYEALIHESYHLAVYKTYFRVWLNDDKDTFDWRLEAHMYKDYTQYLANPAMGIIVRDMEKIDVGVFRDNVINILYFLKQYGLSGYAFRELCVRELGNMPLRFQQQFDAYYDNFPDLDLSKMEYNGKPLSESIEFDKDVDEVWRSWADAPHDELSVWDVKHMMYKVGEYIFTANDIKKLAIERGYTPEN